MAGRGWLGMGSAAPRYAEGRRVDHADPRGQLLLDAVTFGPLAAGVLTGGLVRA